MDLPFRLRNVPSNLHVDYSWRDDGFYGDDSLERQGDYQLVNTRFSIRPHGSRVEPPLWCKNLADTRYISRALETGNGFIKALQADPRTFGATATFHFSAG